MEIRYFYTPKFRYAICKGISVTSTNLADGEPFFFYQVDGKRVTSCLTARGAAGLKQVIDVALEKGYTFPEGVGEVVSWDARYIKVKPNRIVLRPPFLVKQSNLRISFNTGCTHGSFNRAMQSALRTLERHNHLLDSCHDCLTMLGELEREGKLSQAQLAEYRRIKLEV